MILLMCGDSDFLELRAVSCYVAGCVSCRYHTTFDLDDSVWMFVVR